MNNIFYDFEVFIKDWMIICINQTTKEKTQIVNNPDELREFYEQHKEDIWIGYNSRNYDQYILKGILLGMNPYTINNEIIINDKKGNQVVKKSNNFPLNNFDISTGFHSLKQLEGFMGSKIKESSVPFTINRKLTEDELKEVLEYCTHDVEQTIEVFNHRKEEFDSQLSLIQAFNMPMTMFTKTKAQLSAIILDAQKTERNDEFELTIPDTLVISDKYKNIVDWYKIKENMNYKKSLITDVAGVQHVFAWGGIHGAIPNYSYEGIILCCDVASLYPALMIEYGFVSRNVSDSSKYKEIRDTRLKLKAAKNPMQLPYKIVLNATYGAMKDEYNNLYDPLMANNVCIAGQLLLLDLIDKIEPFCELIQSNTDGLFLKINNIEDIEKIKAVAKEWEIRTRLDLEWEIFDKIYQKDVNNYIIIDAKGKYKSKGAYVKKLNAIDYDLPIINDALINYFVHGKQIEDTINECNDLIKYQKIVKVSRLYQHALHGDVKINERVLRVFASMDETSPGVFKVKGEDKIEKIGNTPEHCFIYNEEVLHKSIPKELNKQYYLDMANKRLHDFLDPKVKKHKLPSDIKFITNEIRDSICDIIEENTDTNFIDLLNIIFENVKVSARQINILIILNYFINYGKNKKLMQILDLYNKHGKRKQLKIKDLEKLEIKENILIKYSQDKTENQYRKLDMIGYIKEMSATFEDKQLSIKEQIKNELEYADTIFTTYEQAGDNFYIVIDLKNTDKFKPHVILRQINSGDEIKTKIKEVNVFMNNPFKLFSVLKINEFNHQKKSIMIDGKWGKSSETEKILFDYEVY